MTDNETSGGTWRWLDPEATAKGMEFPKQEERRGPVNYHEAGRVAEKLGEELCHNDPLVYACMQKVLYEGASAEDALVMAVRALSEANALTLKNAMAIMNNPLHCIIQTCAKCGAESKLVPREQEGNE